LKQFPDRFREGTVLFFLADSEKSGQSPMVLWGIANCKILIANRKLPEPVLP
jgi:hypothetical protein